MPRFKQILEIQQLMAYAISRICLNRGILNPSINAVDIDAILELIRITNINRLADMLLPKQLSKCHYEDPVGSHSKRLR